MEIVNKTRYPDATVRRLVRFGMGSWGAHEDQVKVEVRPDSLTNKHYGGARRVGDTAVVQLYVYEHASSYPITQRQVKHEPVTWRSWREQLVATAAHEAWHIRNGYSEQKAEAAGRRKLSAFRKAARQIG